MDGHTPAVPGIARQSSPALVADKEAHVEEEQDGLEIKREQDGNGASDETPAESPGEQPLEEQIDGGHNDCNVGGGAIVALCLEIALGALAAQKGRDAEDHDAYIETRQVGQRLFDNEPEQGTRVPAEDGHGHAQQRQKGEHALQVDAHETILARSVRLTTQRLEGEGKPSNLHVGRNVDGHD